MQRPMKYRTLTFLWLIIPLLVSFLHLQCKETPPEPPSPATLQLKAEDASCTEAWLKASTTQVPATVALLRDNQRVSVIGLRSSDSLLIDEGLLPHRTYTYQLQKLNADSNITETSASVQLTTMDTTSHNFQWQIDTLGVTSSVLYDVAIINDTLAYAVGEMYLRDSTGQIDPTPYGLAVWNGRAWRLRRILVRSQQGSIHSRVFQGVFAFSSTDVWLGDGNAFHWDGRSDLATAFWISGYPGNPTPVLGPNQGVHRFWGTSSSNLYGVGVNGGIAHYNGTWQRVESGTDIRLTDIWGTADGKELWTCGFNDSNGGSIVLRLVNGAWQKVWDRLAPPRPPYIYVSYLGSLWTSGSGEFVLVGGRFYRNSLLDINIVRNEYIYRPDGSSYLFQLGNFGYRVRGSERNDIFLAGDDAMVWHWNGTTWHRYNELTNSDDRLYGLAAYPTMAFAVGARYNGIFRNGLVIRGRR